MKLKFQIRNNIAALLLRNGLKQMDVWPKVGCSRQQLSRWARNEEQPHIGYVLRLHKVTGWALDEMFEERGETND